MHERTPGGGETPTAEAIEPSAPDDFGCIQAWWGDGKGKTTAALGMGMRAVGHGYRVHLLQLMKGGADSVEASRGEYNAIAQLPGYSYENLGHYGWHALNDGSDDRDHEQEAAAGFERARELMQACHDADLTTPFDPEAPADEGVHMLIVDELLYAVDRELISSEAAVEFVESKPSNLELVVTGSHAEPTYLEGVADLISNVRKVAHPFEAGIRARRGTEY